MVRVCTKCQILLSIDVFRIDSKGYVTYTCKPCYLSYLKIHRLKNKDKISNQKAIWHQKNKKQVLYRRKTIPQLKIANALRVRLNMALKGNQKYGSAITDLGCSIDEFKTYLELKFLPGMTWDNHTTFGWHIDHIEPLSKFDLCDSEQLKRACHYTNLQSLWWQDNLSKGGI